MPGQIKPPVPPVVPGQGPVYPTPGVQLPFQFGAESKVIQAGMEQIKAAAAVASGQLNKMVESVKTLATAATTNLSAAFKDVFKLFGAGEGSMKGFEKAATLAAAKTKELGFVANIVGYAFSTVLLKSIRSVGQYMAETLSPNVESVTGGLAKFDTSTQRANVAIKNLALSFEQGQQRALEPFKRALAAISEGLARLDPALVETSGYLTQSGSNIARIAGVAADLGLKFLYLGSAIQLLHTPLKTFTHLLGEVSERYGETIKSALARLAIDGFKVLKESIGSVITFAMNPWLMVTSAVAIGLGYLAVKVMALDSPIRKATEGIGEWMNRLRLGNEESRKLAEAYDQVKDSIVLAAETLRAGRLEAEALAKGDLAGAVAAQERLSVIRKEIEERQELAKLAKWYVDNGNMTREQAEEQATADLARKNAEKSINAEIELRAKALANESALLEHNLNIVQRRLDAEKAAREREKTESAGRQGMAERRLDVARASNDANAVLAAEKEITAEVLKRIDLDQQDLEGQRTALEARRDAELEIIGDMEAQRATARANEAAFAKRMADVAVKTEVEQARLTELQRQHKEVVGKEGRVPGLEMRESSWREQLTTQRRGIDEEIAAREKQLKIDKEELATLEQQHSIWKAVRDAVFQVSVEEEKRKRILQDTNDQLKQIEQSQHGALAELSRINDIAADLNRKEQEKFRHAEALLSIYKEQNAAAQEQLNVAQAESEVRQQAAGQKSVQAELTGDLRAMLAASKELTAEYFEQRRIRIETSEINLRSAKEEAKTIEGEIQATEKRRDDAKKELADMDSQKAEFETRSDKAKQLRLDLTARIKAAEEKKEHGDELSQAEQRGLEVDKKRLDAELLIIAQYEKEKRSAEAALSYATRDTEQLGLKKAQLDKIHATQVLIETSTKKELQNVLPIIEAQKELLRLKRERLIIDQNLADQQMKTAAAAFGGDIGRAMRAGAIDPGKFGDQYRKASQGIQGILRKPDMSTEDIATLETLVSQAGQATGSQLQYGRGGSAISENEARNRAMELARVEEKIAKRRAEMNEAEQKKTKEKEAEAKQKVAEGLAGQPEAESTTYVRQEKPGGPVERVEVKAGAKPPEGFVPAEKRAAAGGEKAGGPTAEGAKPEAPKEPRSIADNIEQIAQDVHAMVPAVLGRAREPDKAPDQQKAPEATATTPTSTGTTPVVTTNIPPTQSLPGRTAAAPAAPPANGAEPHTVAEPPAEVSEDRTAVRRENGRIVEQRTVPKGEQTPAGYQLLSPEAAYALSSAIKDRYPNIKTPVADLSGLFPRMMTEDEKPTPEFFTSPDRSKPPQAPAGAYRNKAGELIDPSKMQEYNPALEREQGKRPTLPTVDEAAKKILSDIGKSQAQAPVLTDKDKVKPIEPVSMAPVERLSALLGQANSLITEIKTGFKMLPSEIDAATSAVGRYIEKLGEAVRTAGQMPGGAGSGSSSGTVVPTTAGSVVAPNPPTTTGTGSPITLINVGGVPTVVNTPSWA